MGKLDDKVAIVTGAARGLGRAYARRLAGLGAKIAVADLDLKSYREFDAEAKAMTAESTADTKASTIDPPLLDLVVSMNLFGTVYSCSAVAPIMKRQRSGKIVTVSSVAGLSASADGGYAHYGAAKAAIAHYTRYLAQDLGPYGITVNCIAPGVITTGRIMQTVLPGSSDSNRDRSELVALRRLGTVEDCAKVVEFLATDLSDYVTGAVIPIDGGLRRG